MGEGLCHCIPVKADFVKVHVDQVVKDFEMYPLPVPNEEMTNLGQPRTNFIQWPRDAIIFTQVYLTLEFTFSSIYYSDIS